MRETSRHVLDAALKGRLTNFHVDLTKFNDVVNYVVSIIKVGALCRWGLLSVELTLCSETMLRTLVRFLLMEDGSTLMLGECRG